MVADIFMSKLPENPMKQFNPSCDSNICKGFGNCRFDCKDKKMLTAKEIEELKAFKEAVIEACTNAAFSLLDGLEKYYPNLVVEDFVDEMTIVLEDWTEEGIMGAAVIDNEDYDN